MLPLRINRPRPVLLSAIALEVVPPEIVPPRVSSVPVTGITAVVMEMRPAKLEVPVEVPIPPPLNKVSCSAVV